MPVIWYFGIVELSLWTEPIKQRKTRSRNVVYVCMNLENILPTDLRKKEKHLMKLE